MPTPTELLESNKAWAAKTAVEKPEFFADLAKQQSPKFLWIGCSDSRVPATLITGQQPGDLFVHRNIANVVVHTDLNLISVLQYAVDVLKVEHVIICGHYGCGGVLAAHKNQQVGIINHWLRHIQDVKTLNINELEALDDDAQFERLCELNVIAQADNLRRTSVLQDAWSRGQKVDIQSWIYNLEDGRIKSLQDAINRPK